MAFILAPGINDKIDEAGISIFFISSPVKGAENNSPFDPIKGIKIFQDSEIINMPPERPSGYVITYAYFVFGKWIGFNSLAEKGSSVSCIKEYIEGPYLVLGESLPSAEEIKLAKKEGSFIIKEINYYENKKFHDKAFIVLWGSDDKILMFHFLENELGKEKYGFPGGHIESGEPSIFTAIREMFEESGIMLRSKNLKMAHVLNLSKGQRDNRTYFYYISEIWDGAPQSTDTKRYLAEWVDILNLPEKVDPYTKQVMKCIGKGETYSLFGYNIDFELRSSLKT